MVEAKVMSQPKFNYSIRSALPKDPRSPASIGAKFVDTLDALSRIDPVTFSNWEVTNLRKRSSVPLAAARPRITAIIEKNVARDDLGQPDPKWGGYTAVAHTSGVSDARRMTFWVNAGGSQEAYTWFQAGDLLTPPDPDIVSYSSFKSALLAITEIWSPLWAWAYVISDDYEAAPLAPGAQVFPYSVFHVPWLGYLSSPFAEGLNVPTDITGERTPDTGVLMIAAEERLDPTNPEHLRRARVLVEVMFACTGKRPGPPPPPIKYAQVPPSMTRE